MSVCDLSVVVPSYNSEKTIRRCLRSLAEQKTAIKFEVIVVDSSRDGTAALVAREFPWAKLIHLDQRAYPGEARNIGIQNTSGEIVAFLASDCVADSRWVETRCRLHQEGFVGVGGAIVNANPQSVVGWANYFMEFIFSLPGRPREEIKGKIIHNLSYCREVFDRCGLFDPSLPMGEDTVFNRQMVLRGEPMIFEPEIIAGHINPTSLRELLVHHFRHGCHFAAACRSGQLAFFKMPSSLAQRVLHLYQPLLFYPIMRVKSCFANVVRHQPRLIPQLLLCFPVFLLGILSAALGIAVGSLR
jgi:glycosyltransferase involved in cell wall biosynthesis